MNVKLKALGLLGLAAGLSSCMAVNGQNSPAQAASAATARTPSATQISLPPASDETAARQRQALIDEINRDGRNAGFEGYRQPSPQPAQQPGQNVVSLNYEQADLRDILAELAEALDISMVIDPTIADKVSLRTAQNRPLTFNDVWPLMNMLARENGVTLEQIGNVWYARKAVSNIALEITTPETTGLSSRVMQITPLRYLSAPAAIELMTPMLEPDGRVVRLANSNSLIITASPTQLVRLNELINLLDDDPFQNRGLQLYPLVNASAADVAQELTEILTLIEGTVPSYQVQGLERINALLVTAPAARGFDEINRWVRILDADRQEQAEQLFQYRVKNLNATELAATLTQVFNIETGQQTEGSPVRLATIPGTPPVAPEQLEAPATTPLTNNQSTAVSADLTVTIVPDEATNSLLVRASPRDYRQLLATISQLDVAPMQVMINAVIAQIVLNDETAFGVDWSRVLDNAASGSSTRIGTGFLPTPPAGQDSGLGGLLFTRSFIDGAARVEATLEAIAVNNDVRLLARPSLKVINNMEGLIRIGAEVPVQLGETIGVGGSSTTNIQYRPTGIELTITPRINDDGVINLTIRQKLSSVSEATGVGANPIFENQEIETTVVVRDGENVVLGGLIQNNNGALNTGVPLLNQVPGLGRLFSYQRDSNERRELFIVLRPEIENLNAQNEARYREILSRFQLVSELMAQP